MSNRAQPQPQPRVSIVVTCYNYGQYLGEALDSALAQTRLADEIIVVNDGSTDNSQEVAENYARRSPTIRVIKQENQGPAIASNNGIAASSGDFFVRLDADDLLDPRFLEVTVPKLQADTQLGYVYTSYRCFGSENRVVKSEPFSKSTLALRPYIVATTLIRREAYQSVGGYSSEMARAYEDWDFYLSLAERGWYGLAVEEVLFSYRRRPGTRNHISLAEWLTLMSLLYRRHPSLYRGPRTAMLGRAVLDRVWARIA